MVGCAEAAPEEAVMDGGRDGRLAADVSAPPLLRTSALPRAAADGAGASSSSASSSGCESTSRPTQAPS